MEKLNKTFKINPLYEADGYKIGHQKMLAPNTTREYWTWIPRNLKYMPKGIDRIMSAGEQLVFRYIHSQFQENFFNRPLIEAQRFAKDMSKYAMTEYDGSHFDELHKLGYLPVKIKSLPEGILTSPNIPHITGINTIDGYAWLGLFLETLVSKLAWQCPTAATIGNKFKQNAVEWVMKTDPSNLWLADFMCHDFHSRGGNPFTSIAVGLGHAMSNSGSDTLNVIPASRYYYDFDENDVPIYSVNASEHSVTCTGIFYYENLLRSGNLNESIKEYYSFDAPCEGSVEEPDYLAIAEWLNLRCWLTEKFPTGILSVVSDTFNLWKLITFILPRLKKEILERDGKLVIRPDSGDPVDIVCGYKDCKNAFINHEKNKYSKRYEACSRQDLSEAEYKGVIELLWDIFGGTTNEQGYKVLDSHISAIYGDSINLEKQINIYTRLAKKGFAATNILLGVGSYTYVYLTRDSAGFAAKGAWFEVKDENGTKGFNIYKDPFTDDGTKKSLKGKCAVFKDEKGEYFVQTECTDEVEESGELHTIYEDGKFYNQTTLTEIRERIKQNM